MLSLLSMLLSIKKESVELFYKVRNSWNRSGLVHWQSYCKNWLGTSEFYRYHVMTEKQCNRPRKLPGMAYLLGLKVGVFPLYANES